MKRLTLGLSLLVSALSLAKAQDSFDFEDLQYRAKVLAEQPYREPESHLPASLEKMTYDDYRKIRFDPMRAFWLAEKLPFQLQFFHPGWLYQHSVQLNQIVDRKPIRIDFSRQLFNYGDKKPWLIPSDMGYAGFRVHYALNRPDYLDEVLVFQGASYFRALARDTHYGLSARGIAVNSGLPGVAEEFPRFEEFWIERPAPGAKQLVIYALLNGKSVTGAYRFVLVPGRATVMEVKVSLYFRDNAQSFGLAPLTSMFNHGENRDRFVDDFRPEVHDSDGLLLERGNGEWLWRPLTNPAAMRTTSFVDENPRGFGLLQRDRQFSHYDDLEANYHLRPSAWIEPVGKWGAGEVQLVELSTPDETNDNIVAFWKPAKLPEKGEPLNFDYKLHWMMDSGGRPPAGYTSSTRISGVLGHAELRRFVVEFDGNYLNAQPDDPEIQAIMSIGGGAKQEGQTSVQKNRYTGAWRVVFELKPDGSGKPVELRAFLKKDQHVLTETWSYLWKP